MPNIRIERVPIKVNNYGKFGADHLQLVYQQDALDFGEFQDRWFVLEGTFQGSASDQKLGIIGADGFLTLGQANATNGVPASPEQLLDLQGYPLARGSRIISSDDPFGDWTTMMAVGNNIDQQEFPYYPIGTYIFPFPICNSSSAIASLLFYMDRDIELTMPFASGLRFTVGIHTLLGTSEDDELQIQWGFDTILSGDGNDKLSGTDNKSKIEKLYGGRDNDEFKWSQGTNYLHGGETRLSYDDDGTDLVDYRGVGLMYVEVVQNVVEHLIPNMIAKHTNGVDHLFSIERFRWNTASDTIVVSPGAHLITDRLLFDFDLESEDGEGDVIDFSDQESGLLFNPSDNPDVVLMQGGDNAEEDSGIWLQSAEWLIGSAGDDRIYASTGLRGVEGGIGDDVLDGRLVTPFSLGSPEGYDIELDGGKGADTIVSGAGRSLATGGAGADTFVLSTLTTGANMVEFVIENASFDDQLLIPYNFVRPEGGEFEGSDLMPVLGGFYANELLTSFGDLSQDPNPYGGGSTEEPGFVYILWQTQLAGVLANDSSQGVLDFAGDIQFNRDGNDLLIHIYAGVAYEETYIGRDEMEHTGIFTSKYSNSETLIRVKNFTEGMLGINFYHTGTEYTDVDFIDNEGPGTATIYNNVDDIIRTIMNNGVLFNPLDDRPETAIFDFDDGSGTRDRRDGTDGDDVIVMSDAGNTALLRALTTAPGQSTGADIFAFGGNDTITGSNKRDTIDGGSGADQMSGRRGSDTYSVDNSSDVVIENEREGTDTIISSIDYVLPEFVEDLKLSGLAVSGTGNDVRNRLYGTQGENWLVGRGGDDTLYGGTGGDTLDGGQGNDAFVYLNGDGNDIIVDTGAAGDRDVLILSQLTTAGTTVLRSTIDADDVIVRFADGGRIVLDEFLAGDSIEAITFEDGTVWERSAIVSVAGASPAIANDAPVAASDEGLYTYSRDITIGASEFLANDSDFENDTLTIISATTTTAGAAVSVTADGNIRIAVDDAFDGMVNFTYTIADGRGGEATAQADISILPNSAPAVAPAGIANQASAEDEAWSFTVPAATFSDPDGQPLTLIVALASGAALPSWLSFDSVTHTFRGLPPANFNGVIDLRVTASDSAADVTADFRLTITAVDDAPIVAGAGIADQLSVEDATWTFTIPGNVFTDPDGQPLAFTATLSNGAALPTWLSFDAATRTLQGTPPQNFNGAIDVRVTASDGTASVHTGFRLTITPVNDAPVAAASGVANQSSPEDAAWTFAVPANAFSDPDGGALAFAATLANGTALPTWLSFDAATRAFHGTPPQNFNGAIDVRVTASDGSASAASGFRLTVAPVNDAPVASGDTGFQAVQGTVVILTAAQLLANDYDIDGDTFSIVSVQDAANGTVALDAQGRVVFTPAAGYSGDASFSYTVSDGHTGFATATAGVTVTPTTVGTNTITGTARADRLHGTSAADIIDGLGGNDRLYGHGGDDTFLVSGNAGFDRYDGGSGVDTIQGSAGNDIIGLANGSFSLANIEVINGGAGFDILRLSAKRDTLDLSSIAVTGIERIDAGAGNDRITASSGADILRGGAGCDRFVFKVGFGHDTIEDFELGHGRWRAADVIDLRSANFNSFSDMKAHASQVGDDTLITVNAGSSLRLLDTDLRHLRLDDFLL